LHLAPDAPPPDRPTALGPGGDATALNCPAADADGSSRLSEREPADPPAAAGDSELLEAVRRGDRRAFHALYDRFGAEVLALCERILHQRADAEDAVADVFWEVWQRRERYDAARGGARAYLMTLARSRAIDRLRSHVARPEARVDSGRRLSVDDQLTAPVPSPEQFAAYAETKLRVADAFARLEPRQREAMELAYYEGLSHQQIAERMATPLGTVKTYIRKGLTKLRYALKGLRMDDPR